MIIGTSRLGIGRLGIRSGNYTENSVSTNASILDRILVEFNTNATIVELLLEALTTNADILDGYQRTFTTNASIIAAIDLALTTNASIADLASLSFTTNAYIIQTFPLDFTTNASILGPVAPVPFTTNASICGPVDTLFTTNAYIAQQIALSLLTNAYISEYVSGDFTTNANVAIVNGNDFTTNARIVDIRYWAIGPAGSLIDLSGIVYDPQTRGFGLKTSQQKLPEGRRVTLQDDGIEGGEFEMTILFRSDTARKDFQKLVNNDSEDIILHRGRSDRYYHVKRVAVEPDEDELWRGLATLRVTCKMEDPYLYHDLDQGLDLGASPLPQPCGSRYNYGSVEAPILFRIGGQYFGGQLYNPAVACMDGAVVERNLLLGGGLLSNEFAELTREGAEKYYLTHTYADNYSTNNYWQYDAIQSGCSLSGGQVSVPAGKWFAYLFQGYPTKENIKLLATITKVGSPIIQYSTDYATWTTAIAASEIVSGIQTEYYLTGTEKLSTIYVRFYSPTGSSMTIQDVSFSMLRDISSQYNQIPMVPAGLTRAIRVSGTGSTKAKIKDTFRSRWHAA